MKTYTLAICGGGSTYTLPMLKTLCDFHQEFPVGEVRLYDIDYGKQDMIYRAAKVLFAERLPDTVVKSCYGEDKREAFENVDFVFMQIRAGGLAMREMDEKIPLSYGCVGQETCGAGGFAYGMRSVPQVLQLVDSIRGYSPEAWIINYSNPAAIVAEALKRFHPSDKRLINLCDMPIAIMDGFAECLGMERGEFSPRYFGLNHFGWFTHLYDRMGKDRLPEIQDKLKEGGVMPMELSGDEGWVHTFNQLQQMVADLDGYVPNTYLQYYLYPDKIARESNKDYTRANSVMDHRLKDVEQTCRYIAEQGTTRGSALEKGVHGTYIVELASSIIRNKGNIFLIIVRNGGIIPNLPSDAMVEVPCLVGVNGCEPMHVGEIGTFYKALLENQYGYETLTVDAVLNGDMDAALKALTLNRTVTDVGKAKKILADLCEANKEYWVLDGGKQG